MAIPNGSPMAPITFGDFAADARVLADTLAERSGVRPVVVGASLGGIAALLAEGGDERAGRRARVLGAGAGRHHAAGRSRRRLQDPGLHARACREGFGSVDEAADAVAAYLPHRPRPRSHEGLKKNLRLHPDGRWRWHWDPRFLDGRRRIGAGLATRSSSPLVEAARRIPIPALLVRGGSSELVQEAHAKEFLELVPHANYVDVSGARHMVAGDRNDQFADAIEVFLSELEERLDKSLNRLGNRGAVRCGWRASPYLC